MAMVLGFWWRSQQKEDPTVSISLVRTAPLVFALSAVLALGVMGCGETAGTGGTGGDGGDTTEPEAFTLVVLPDTQYYAESYPAILQAQAQWIEEEAATRQIIGVLHEGDVTDENSEEQWQVASDALLPLIDVVPLVLALGNHDYGFDGLSFDRTTLAHDFFPVERITAQPTFGGSYERGRIDNTYSVLETPEGPWLVLSLEFGPRDEVIDWANEVVVRHEDMPAIVLTHAYLYFDDTRYDWATKGLEQRWSPHTYVLAGLAPVNDGQAIFDKLVRRHEEIDFVFCGHVLDDGVARLMSSQDAGGVVHEILANYQMNDMGGEGFLRLIEFREGSDEVRVRTYSPLLDEYKEDADNQFTLLR
jgi:hypothetical protein